MLPIAPNERDSQIRSFILRTNRIGPEAAGALDKNWDTYGFSVDGAHIDPAALFVVAQPVMLEIGFGMGTSTATMAAEQRELNVIAIDVHTPGIASLMRAIDTDDLQNLRVACGDVVVLLREMLPAGCLDGVRIFFPDPWPKLRHVKRRLITTDFLDLLATAMKPGASLHCATDWAPYFTQISRTIAQHDAFALTDEIPWRVETKFERAGAAAGRSSQDLAAMRL